MIFYTYNEKTKEFTGTQNGFIDPLETKKQGKNVYLVPPNATDKKPLKTKKNQAVIFNGSEWEIITDYRNKTYYIGTEKYEMKELGDLPKGATFEPVEPKKTLDELKAEKLLELTILCHNFDDRLVNNDMYVISSLGFKVNADLRSQNNIKGLIAVNADTVNFVDYNNEIHKLTQKDLNTLLIECSKNGENLYMQKWTYAEKIKACKAIKELEKIDFNFVMLDFSKE